MIMSMAILELMTRTFWMNNGFKPTHVIMTTDQQKELSNTMVPKERIEVAAGSAPDRGIVVVHLSGNIVLDILTVAPLRSGQTHGIGFPLIVNLEKENYFRRLHESQRPS